MTFSDVKIRVAGAVSASIEDGPGYRYTLFTQGCYHNCMGCHNPQTHDVNGGTERTIGEILEEIKKNPLLDGITLSGGEPFLQAEALTMLAVQVHAAGMNVVTYTGYTYEELLKLEDEFVFDLLCQTDILIDGRFEIDKKTLDLPFRGSSNQRMIDVKETMKKGEVVLWSLPPFCEY